MISYIKGTVAYLEPTIVVIENQGIGYTIYISEQTASQIPSPGQDIKLFTYMNVREDAMQLFGFLTRDDLNVFKLVIGVSGIGPKGGLNILSQLSPDELRFAVMAHDVKAISAAPGIGKKTAEKLIIELKDKLSIEDVLEKTADTTSAVHSSTTNVVQAEAVQALAALGYGNSEALKAVKKVEIDEDTTVEDVLKQALKYIMF